MYRIASEYRPVEDFEKAGIGADEVPFKLVAVCIQINITVENKGRARTDLNAGYLFHKAHRYGTAHLPVIVFIPVLRVIVANRVHPVDVLVKTVVTQLKEHLGNEHDAHG